MKNRYIILSDNKFQLFAAMGAFISAGFDFEWRASSSTVIVTVGDFDFDALDSLAQTLKFDFKAFTES